LGERKHARAPWKSAAGQDRAAPTAARRGPPAGVGNAINSRISHPRRRSTNAARERDRARRARDLARSVRPGHAGENRYRSVSCRKPLLREELTDRATPVSLRGRAASPAAPVRLSRCVGNGGASGKKAVGIGRRVAARVAVSMGPAVCRDRVVMEQRRADRRQHIAGQNHGDGELLGE